MSRTLSGLFLVGALNRPRKRKRTNRENPRTIPEQIGKIPERSGGAHESQSNCHMNRTVKLPSLSGPLRLRVQSRSRIGITAACYRTENAQIPKSAAGSAGKSAGEKRSAGGTAGSSAESSRFLWKSRETALLPAVPPALRFSPALLPALPAALLGIWAFSVL